MKHTVKKVLGAASIAAAAFAVSSPAQAAMCVQVVTSTVASLPICDNQAGDVNGTIGLINFNFNDANWSGIVEIGSSKPLIGSAALPQLDIAYTMISGNGQGTASLYLWDTDFLVGGAFSGALLNGGTAQSMDIVTGVAIRADNVVANYTSFTWVPQLSLVNANGLFGSQTNVAFSDPNQFALGMYVGFNPNAENRTSITTGNANYRVPEPGTLALLGLGLAGLGFAARRRQK